MTDDDRGDVGAEREDGERRPVRELGASLVEYAFLVALIAIVCLVAVAFFGTDSSRSLSTSGESISAN